MPSTLSYSPFPTESPGSGFKPSLISIMFTELRPSLTVVLAAPAVRIQPKSSPKWLLALSGMSYIYDVQIAPELSFHRHQIGPPLGNPAFSRTSINGAVLNGRIDANPGMMLLRVSVDFWPSCILARVRDTHWL
jgi:hypothetical protein